MPYDVEIKTSDTPVKISIELGQSVIFVGANGSGKTRLAVDIENQHPDESHRISAHRALNLETSVPKIPEEDALRHLRYGETLAQFFSRSKERRWRNKAATHLLDDYNFVLQALFAEQGNTALKSHKAARAGTNGNIEPTKFEKLQEIWGKIMPHRNLDITHDTILVKANEKGTAYSASEMSDGERAIFYLIGQILLAKNESLLIIDEPELHLHPSIISKLWDELEAVRPDCAFIFITHELGFAAARHGRKYVLNNYNPSLGWNIEEVPTDTGFSEETTTLILGSRRPILFVEGEKSSLDFAVYNCAFPDALVLPVGGCSEVIQSVVSMRNNDSLTRVTCSGIVDADGRSEEEKDQLKKYNIATLPVSEIENIFVLPTVSRAILKAEEYEETEILKRLADIKLEISETLKNDRVVIGVLLRHCRRQIDFRLKQMDLSTVSDTAEIKIALEQKIAEIDVEKMVIDAEKNLRALIDSEDLEKLLALYDNKQLLALAAKHLSERPLKSFKGWIVRKLNANEENEIQIAIRDVIPDIAFS